MTQEQFAKYGFRHSEIIVYHQKHPATDIEMMLIGVDFDNGLFHLYPFDNELYEEKDYWVHYSACDRPKKNVKLKIIQ